MEHLRQNAGQMAEIIGEALRRARRPNRVEGLNRSIPIAGRERG